MKKPLLSLLGALLVISTAGVALTAAPQAASAQQDRNKAKKVYREAKKAYDAKDFEAAAGLFLEAYEYDPKPELLFNIGQAYKEAGRYVKAAEYLQRFLQERPDAPNKDEVAQQLYDIQLQIAAQASTVTIQAPADGIPVFVDDEAEPRCVTPCLLTLSPMTHQVRLVPAKGAPQTLEITPDPGSESSLAFDLGGGAPRGQLTVRSSLDRGELVLDGRSRASFPIARPLELEVGSYPASIRIDGETVWTGSVEIQPDAPAVLDVIALAPARDEEGGGGSVMTLAGWSLGAAGIASLGAGLFFGLSATSIEDDLQAQLDAGRAPDQDLLAQGESQALFANVFYGVGALSLISGALLIILDDGGGEASASAPGDVQVLVSPQPSGGVVGLGVSY